MLILKTKTNEYIVEPQGNDVKVFFSKNREEIPNMGLFITNMGGKETLLSRCKEYTEEELRKKHLLEEKSNRLSAEGKIRKEIKMKEDATSLYNDVFANEVTETSPHTIFVLLNYLQFINWGIWRLPKMTIGYKCNQYDCYGKIAVTISLDSPINYNSKKISKFQLGAPRGHLTKYTPINDRYCNE